MRFEQDFRDRRDRIIVVAWLVWRIQNFFGTNKRYRQHYEVRIKLRISCISNQVLLRAFCEKSFYLFVILDVYTLSDISLSFRRVFFMKFCEAVHFCRAGGWKSPWEREGETSRIGRTVVVRMYWRLSRMYDHFQLRKDGHCTSLPLAPLVKYVRDANVTAISMPYNETLLLRVAPGPLQPV